MQHCLCAIDAVTFCFVLQPKKTPTGRPNCPSGYDESEQECGSRLIELPGGIYAAFGCVAAAISACLIFCLLVMVKKRRKANEKLKPTVGNGAAASLNGTLSKKDYKKEPLFFDPDS